MTWGSHLPDVCAVSAVLAEPVAPGSGRSAVTKRRRRPILSRYSHLSR